MTTTRSRLAVMYGTALLVLLVDQLTKLAVLRSLGHGRVIHVVGSFAELRYTTNSGGAFSLLTGFPWFFAVMAVVVAMAIALVARRMRGLVRMVALGLLLGGALGNLADRLFRGVHPLSGQVVDFIAVWRWPVFNVADSCIVIGGLLLAIMAGRADRPVGRPATAPDGSRPAAGPVAPPASPASPAAEAEAEQAGREAGTGPGGGG